MRELRLGLVCYGGVSLAIYMHGITVELQRLVRASRAYCDEPTETNPFPPDATEAVYWDALDAIARAEDRLGGRTPLRVVVDVIAGTSAGGINGVVLAKALAHDLDQTPLQQVWFEKAGLHRLLPWRQLTPKRLFRGETPGAPLDGELMTRWVHEALSAMNPRSRDGGDGSLMPPGHELDLYVTLTDCGGYTRTIDIHDPENIFDREHRHVLRFRYRRDWGDGAAGGGGGSGRAPAAIDHFDAAHDRALTLAIRCTSSFPGAFPPVSVAELRRVIGEFADDAEREAFIRLCFAPYLLEGDANPERSYFVDGGVLNNRPFDHAVRAILERPARHEVDRRLLFIEPHPAEARPAPSDRRPSWARTVIAALSSIPRQQPIADALLDLARYNQRVAEIRLLVAAAAPEVERLIERTADDLGLPPGQLDDLSTLDFATLERWRRAIQERARAAAGAAFGAYQAIKINDVVRDLADGICNLFDYPAGSRHAILVRRVVRRWFEIGDVIPADGEDGLAAEQWGDPGSQREFLETFDLNFRRRRLRFLVGYLNQHYRRPTKESGGPTPDRARLDAVKAELYALIGTLRAIQGGGWVGDDLKGLLARVFGPEEIVRLDRRGEDGEQAARRLDRFIGDHGQTLLSEIYGRLKEGVDREMRGFWERQERGLTYLIRDSGLPPELLRGLLERYVGFAYWDVFLYPPMAVGDIAELDQIEVVRISPADTRLLEPRGVMARLKGVAAFHFGSFFRRAYRENDFLWGRLDGVERLMAVLGDAAERQGGTPLDPSLAWRGFAAVLASERPNMMKPASRKLIETLKEQVSRNLATGAPAPPGPV